MTSIVENTLSHKYVYENATKIFFVFRFLAIV